MQRVTSSHLPSSKSRQLNWANCYNTRDLGRLPTLDGYETKSHAIIHSDMLGRLTEHGQQALLYEKLVKEAGGEDNIGPWMKPTATPAVIIQMFDHLDRQYGGVRNYLQTCGLTINEIYQLKERLSPD